MVLTVSLTYLINVVYPPTPANSRGSASEKRGKTQAASSRNQGTRNAGRPAAGRKRHPAFGVRFGSLGKQSGRGVRFGSLASLQGSENDVRHGRPSVAWCFAVARPRFWRLEGCHLGLLSVQKATLHSMGSGHQTL